MSNLDALRRKTRKLRKSPEPAATGSGGSAGIPIGTNLTLLNELIFIHFNERRRSVQSNLITTTTSGIDATTEAAPTGAQPASAFRRVAAVHVDRDPDPAVPDPRVGGWTGSHFREVSRRAGNQRAQSLPSSGFRFRRREETRRYHRRRFRLGFWRRCSRSAQLVAANQRRADQNTGRCLFLLTFFFFLINSIWLD